MRTGWFVFARLPWYYAPLAVRICAAVVVLCAPGGSYLRRRDGIMRPGRAEIGLFSGALEQLQCVSVMSGFDRMLPGS